MSSEGIDSRESSRESDSRSLSEDFGGLLAFLGVSLGVAAVAGLSTFSTINGWYAQAEKTLWNPPHELFPPLWGVIYTLIAISGWLAWRRPASDERRRALGLFGGQLAMNAAWTPLFFVLYDLAGGVALWIALAWIVLLDFVVLATIVTLWPVSKVSSVLVIPYWVWLLFATALNASIAVMNS